MKVDDNTFKMLQEVIDAYYTKLDIYNFWSGLLEEVNNIDNFEGHVHFSQQVCPSFTVYKNECIEIIEKRLKTISKEIESIKRTLSDFINR